MISLYDLFMIPLEKSGIIKARKELIPKAKGTILEIGSGTGVNIKYYNFDAVDKLTMTDKKLSKKIRQIASTGIELIEVNVEELPFLDNSFDYIIHTLVFCSVSDVNKGIQELKRVLKPTGTIMFIEHILPEKKGYKGLFNFVNPAWRRIASGCNLNRDYESSLLANGFKVINSSKFMNTAFVYGEAIIQ
ncbi:Ubiquinone/menaquinone biosynthesis C-methyltransferase UbiE [Candidatus Izimaplasma bacterium HR1]|jgi:ubiquinone/menaquinone biosynthesis C-methylase UbiE|uniref:class I SAM-dependent methyltransferase n=1 Tax=Candidatus Izimoplasma sp. HR1 TaxID=1541959 RepID=UPI0004F814EB|nr:Ubiquinone/menaquinone biosynthesis C-methyltransferase UbiE [Candidatus Izimaplasma bacterium HR1]